MLEIIAKRKKSWIGHVVRGGEDAGHRGRSKRLRSRPRKSMMDDIMIESYDRMKRRTLDREGGKFGCRGPAMQQRTDDDEIWSIIYLDNCA